VSATFGVMMMMMVVTKNKKAIVFITACAGASD
jgi:hypothetical protein